ncbi:MAG: hypothetical protein ACR2NZ_09520 [Rubripirellula sp.]
MNTTTSPLTFHQRSAFMRFGLLSFACMTMLAAVPCSAPDSVAQDSVAQESVAQESVAQESVEQASINSSIGSDGTGTIVVQARGQLPEPQLIYTAISTATVKVGPKFIDQTIQLNLKIIQGRATTLSFGLQGKGQVTDVQGENVLSWSVRQVNSERFLDLHLKDEVADAKPVITIRSDAITTPGSVELTHITPGESVGFDSTITIEFAPEWDGLVSEASGFSPLKTDAGNNRFHTTTGGKIQMSFSRSGVAPAAVEMMDTQLDGDLHANGESIDFQLRSTAVVNEANAILDILSGSAAVRVIPKDAKYRLRLTKHGKTPVYQLIFPEAGSYPIELDFVARLLPSEGDGHAMDFTVGASAVVPLVLNGFESNLNFHRDQQSVAPLLSGTTWSGFLPATGRAQLKWKAARQTGDGKLFFTTSGKVEAKIGAGLLRQHHEIQYQVLQGELKSIEILMQGPGEILDVQGSNIIGWNVNNAGEDRVLEVALSQPMTGASQIKVRSQTPLGAFPVRVEGLRLNPIDTVRHSGFLRLTNLGSVRLEPTALSGLTQLAPEQFPGDPSEARQIFVYRFPSGDHDFTIAADRIQPEVNVSEVVTYKVAEADRVIRADVELDVREAPIREWDFGIPADYSVVSVAGASVADYITATEVADGLRNLRVMFGQDVSGRQLVTLHLEKSEAADAGDWALPRIDHSNAKTVRGDIGIIGAPGFRVVVAETDLLVEKPLSYFPKPTAGLQQAFRIREPGWSATMRIEPLERSVQSDVFHLYSLSQETVYGSALINYFVTGAPVSEWRMTVPAEAGNLMVDGQDVRTWRREEDTLIVSLHQPVMGGYTLLVTFEEKPVNNRGSFQAGQITPLGVQGERGYIQVVSPMQVELDTVSISADMLKLDPLELPAEFRLLSTAPPLGTWQYTERPFDLNLKVNWFQPGTTVTQVVEFSEANSRVSRDGELVTDVLYYVKSRGRRSLKVALPEAPVRLWEVSVDGQVVTARQTEDATLIPLPGGTDPNVPIEVRLRLGKPTVKASRPELALPIVFAPVLKTQWNVTGDEQYLLVPNGGTVAPPTPVNRTSGFSWVAMRGSFALFMVALFTTLGIWGSEQRKGVLRVLGLLGLAIAIGLCVSTASRAASTMGVPIPLQLSLPILSAGEPVQLDVKNMPLWRVDISWFGLAIVLGGVAAIAWSLLKQDWWRMTAARSGGLLLIAFGVLLQGGGAPWFFALLAIAIFALLFLSPMRDAIHDLKTRVQTENEAIRAKQAAAKADAAEKAGGSANVTTALLAMLLASACSSTLAVGPSDQLTADSIEQRWEITNQDTRLDANATITVSGHPGDQFLLLRAPAVLTQFEGEGLRLAKREVPGEGLMYVISIPVEGEIATGEKDAPELEFEANFKYQLESLTPTKGIPVLTGSAAVQVLELNYDEAGWDVSCTSAVRVESVDANPNSTAARVLLGPGSASVMLKPKARDVTAEETQFFVESSNLYVPSPGVIDGRHRLEIRTAQGQVSELNVLVPSGLTVSAVSGPVGSWQFDADSGRLKLELEPIQSQPFEIMIETQRGLDQLPADASLAPLKVDDANGEVGLVAIAFSADSQPEKLEAEGMSVVNLGDFDKSLITNKDAVLHRVYRFGSDSGEITLRVAPVEPEVRLISKQVLSLGDERVVLGINFAAEISRAGLFQLSFPLPDGLEVESLTGDSLHHWAELSEGDQRRIILHLNGKTIGTQNFSLALSGVAPTDAGEWTIPHFELNEATRQTGELVVRPTTGIRLRTMSRQNVSETDPRMMGGEGQGSLAFRLLQRNWSLVLEIEKLDPWVTGQVLHEVTLREGQTRSTLVADFNVQNASIRGLQVALPISNDDETKTLRASGDIVSDFVRTAPDSNLWEVQFKRRVVGKIQFRIEYERRGGRQNETEALFPAEFPQARQLSYFFALRAGGRLELELDKLSQGWQRADWNAVPQTLRNTGNRSAPALVLRAAAPPSPLNVRVMRHSLAEALKLRVAEGSLTTVLSPTGNQLTAVDLTIEVIQRSSLSVGLPKGDEIFSIFVNGESVNSIRLGNDTNTWQFYILPGIDDRTAKVRFVYSVAGDRLSSLKLASPELNVPLENIQWNVVAPTGYELVDNDGNLDLVRLANQEAYDRTSYLSKISGKRQVQAQQAAQLLAQANQLLQAGEQFKARRALNSVANRYALDAASNEDARVQLENLQTQQAIVGLNTRRQRLYLDNKPTDSALADNKQLRAAAAVNPILQQDAMNFRPQQLSELLRGNTTEDNAVLQQIAGRLVQHQHTTEPAPQAILISLPEEGSVYTFGRSVQVAENTPLELDLDFGLLFRIHFWQVLLVLLLLIGFASVLAIYPTLLRESKRST